jgi:hypothetical protein
MIPVQQQPEPVDFDKKVRIPGNKFLQSKPVLKGKNVWKNHEDWQKSLEDLYTAYSHICAYTATWIPKPEGTPTVDHFVPKSVTPEKAYEWSNFRLTSHRVNTWKGTHQDILDPFKIGVGWFEIDFSLLEIKPSPKLESELQVAVLTTIERLKLNGFECIRSRENWLRDYCMHGNLECLKRRAPFIAYELKRQNLTQKVIEIWGRANKNR